MDNVGDWIYIVFLIVAAISGLFSSKNKKKRPTQVLGQPGHDSYPEENTSSGKGFWEILEEATTPQKPEAPTAPIHKKKKKDTCLKTIFIHRAGNPKVKSQFIPTYELPCRRGTLHAGRY